MRLPQPRGPVSTGIIQALRHPPGTVKLGPAASAFSGDDPLHDEDLQIALWTCYELHYRGFAEVDDRWEWEPSLLALRAALERRLEQGLAERVPRPAVPQPAEVPAALAELTAADDGPSLPVHLLRHGSREQLREVLVHRSVFQLKEADPHTWGIPRLGGPAKAALVEVQADEYGGGRPERVHQQLFRDTLHALGLDGSYGRYVDDVPAGTLATSTTQSLFGLHRRWLGALVGHLAAFEMTSSIPNRHYVAALRRLGYGDEPAAIRFFAEHVEADAVHEQVAAHDLCGSLVAEQPERTGDVMFGAACSLAMDRMLADHLLDCWQRGVSSLRTGSVPAA